MRIAQVAPLCESVPPKFYGGTERVVSYLTEALVEQGHDVTLYASGDSATSARLVSTRSRATRLDPACRYPDLHHVHLVERVFGDIEARPSRFDVVHFHLDHYHYSLARRCPAAVLTTRHGRLDLPDALPLSREFAEHPLVSISDAQRRPLPDLNWLGTVHHGLPPGLLAPGKTSLGYLVFLGRISPEKGVERAIAIAKAVGRPLKIAAKIEPADLDYLENVVRPLLDDPLVEFVGEVDERGKERLLQGADGLLFPIDWPEPFGLVMIEALACGCPVLAWRGGSVAEVVEPGVTGFIVDSLEEAAAAARRLPDLDRRQCRAAFERRFQSDRMARDYVRLYRQLIQARARAARARPESPWTRSSVTGISSIS